MIAVREAIAVLTAELQAKTLLQVGDIAPDFTLPATTGQNLQFKTLLTQGLVVLNFYRGAGALIVHWS